MKLSEIKLEPTDPNRRAFVRGMAGTIAGAAVGAAGMRNSMQKKHEAVIAHIMSAEKKLASNADVKSVLNDLRAARAELGSKDESPEPKGKPFFKQD